MHLHLTALLFVTHLIIYCTDGKSLVIRNADDYHYNSQCAVDGSIYKPGERIPRTHPCHICICMEGVAQCAWQDCPLPPEDCSVLEFQDICNPSLYLCQIPDVLGKYRKRNRIARRGSDVEPEEFNENSEVGGDCNILGVPYKTGDVVGAASHNCLECRCGKQDLYCSPRCCFRASSLMETPGQIMSALIIGSKLPQKHPLQYLIPDQS